LVIRRVGMKSLINIVIKSCRQSLRYCNYILEVVINLVSKWEARIEPSFR
jgi:hypothetical protein